MAARISEIFFYKKSEMDFFIKNSHLTKKFWRVGGAGVLLG